MSKGHLYMICITGFGWEEFQFLMIPMAWCRHRTLIVWAYFFVLKREKEEVGGRLDIPYVVSLY